MSGFNEVVKHLDIVRARKASDDDLRTSGSLIDPLKYTKLTKTRAVKKITQTLELPAFNYAQSQYPVGIASYQGRMLFQYNVTTESDFYILNYAPTQYSVIENPVFGHLPVVQNGVLTVKWRVGTTVYRYIIQGSPRVNLGSQTLFFPFYNNQKISKNCVFEYWFRQTTHAEDAPVLGLYDNLFVEISLLENPANSDETSRLIEQDAPITIDDFGIVGVPAHIGGYEFPPFPIDNSIICWLDNP